MLQELFAWFWCFPKYLLRSFDLLSDYLCMVTIACLRQIDRSVTSSSIKSFECESSSSTLQASSHFDHIPFHTQFLCISSNPQTLHDQDLIKLWDGKQMRQYLLPIYYETFGSYFYVCLLCHAMLVDVDWVSVSMTDVRLLINGST